MCCKEAEESGAKIRIGEKIEGKRLESLCEERILIGADGPLSTVARHFGMGPLGRHVLTYKAEFDAEVPDGGTVDMFFDNKITPGFFGWLCPKSKGIVEAGVGIDSNRGNSKAAFDRFVKQKEIVSILDGHRMLSGYASLIPMDKSRKVVDEKHEVLLVGDAAGHIKHTTGGGIVFGGNAAIIAAETINAHIKSGKSLKEYGDAFRKRFGADMFLHGVAKGVYSTLGAGQIASLLKVSKLFGIEGFLSEYGDMDRPSLIIKRVFSRK